ncbi:DUF3040 domain-containing protein [Actinomyces gaoshouyii]|uniref:DUF3040 domain-containing protein n=1 Tax=Actinomyces gaoshouyii TaxID=1960083 RepID=A0A8H9HA58_9ACTO|nr:DUF3040 domain-containing protein [Actinomyces gaoshouyii]ARD41897.1 hypothetical protein B6G06_05715 [Actinomyces gaoshouyii]GGO99903.1 hypothetical protein GCM10011612_18270 [Actinomyces gaoshouyii]
MSLSEREQRVLRDLERQLHEEDPTLAETIQYPERHLARVSPRNIGWGIALVLVGLVVVISGVVLGHGNGLVSIIVGVTGFGLAVAGVALMVRRPPVLKDARGGMGKDRTGRSTFMERQSERWERRRDGDR